MMVGHCHSHSSRGYGQCHPNNYHHRHYPPHRHSRSGSEASRDTNDHYSSTGSSGVGSSDDGGGRSIGGESSNDTTTSSSAYSLAISSDAGERSLHRHPSTTSLLDSIERRTQRTYRYGIGLVCIGATLNWLGFAQGTSYIDPLRYLGVACVLTGSFCVCLAMCRWLSKPISVSGHHVSNLEEERSNGDVHVINVAVPMYVSNLHEEYRPTKPPDYEQIVGGDEPFPPPYDEAVKLRPSDFFGTSTPSHQGSMIVPSGLITDAASAGQGGGNFLCAPQCASNASCQPTPSHHPLSLLLDQHSSESLIGNNSHPMPTIPQSFQLSNAVVEEDPPPAYEPSPRPSISSCSSSAPLIPTSTSRFDLPPSFSVRRIFGGGPATVPTSSSRRKSPVRRRESGGGSSSGNNDSISEPLQEQVINEDGVLSLAVQQPSLSLGNCSTINSDVNMNSS